MTPSNSCSTAGCFFPPPNDAFFRDGVSIAANPALKAESSTVVELNYRRSIGEWLSAQAGVYYQNAENVVQQRNACFAASQNNQDVFVGLQDDSGACTTGVPRVQAANLGSLRSIGGELGAQLNRRGFSAYAQVTVQGTLERFVGEPEEEPENSPRWLVMAGGAVPLYKQNLFLSLEVEAIGERRSDPRSVIIPAFAVVDAGLASVKLTEHFDFQAKVQNLFDTPVYGPAIAEDISPIARVPQARRTFFLLLRGFAMRRFLPLILCASGCLYSEGSGHQSTLTSNATGFDTVVVEAPIDVSVIAGDNFSAQLTGDDNLQKIYSFDQEGAVLYVRQHDDAYLPRLGADCDRTLANPRWHRQS